MTDVSKSQLLAEGSVTQHNNWLTASKITTTTTTTTTTTAVNNNNNNTYPGGNLFRPIRCQRVSVTTPHNSPSDLHDLGCYSSFLSDCQLGNAKRCETVVGQLAELNSYVPSAELCGRTHRAEVLNKFRVSIVPLLFSCCCSVVAVVVVVVLFCCRVLLELTVLCDACPSASS